jgi:hypothetical protein
MTTVCCSATAAISAGSHRKQANPALHAGFLKLLPAIRRYAHVCFRRLPAAAREEAITEVLADAFVLYARLNSLGKPHLAYATALARYGVGHFREGRRVGGQSNANDVMSERCLRRNGIVVRSLRQRDESTGNWREIVVEDRHSTPGEIAGLRIDFANWLESLSTRDRQIAETLARGETTASAARMFQISAGRVSQLRRDLCQNWHKFIGELADAGAASLATA